MKIDHKFLTTVLQQAQQWASLPPIERDAVACAILAIHLPLIIEELQRLDTRLVGEAKAALNGADLGLLPPFVIRALARGLDRMADQLEAARAPALEVHRG